MKRDLNEFEKICAASFGSAGMYISVSLLFYVFGIPNTIADITSLLLAVIFAVYAYVKL